MACELTTSSDCRHAHVSRVTGEEAAQVGYHNHLLRAPARVARLGPHLHDLIRPDVRQQRGATCALAREIEMVTEKSGETYLTDNGWVGNAKSIAATTLTIST